MVTTNQKPVRDMKKKREREESWLSLRNPENYERREKEKKGTEKNYRKQPLNK